MSRILVLEDNKNLRTLYALELGAEGYEVILAGSQQEALDRLASLQPDLVIIDPSSRQMANMDWLANLMSRISNVRIIINAASDIPEGCVLTQWADACLTKSADFSELKVKIRQLLSPLNQEQGVGAC